MKKLAPKKDSNFNNFKSIIRVNEFLQNLTLVNFSLSCDEVSSDVTQSPS